MSLGYEVTIFRSVRVLFRANATLKMLHIGVGQKRDIIQSVC